MDWKSMAAFGVAALFITLSIVIQYYQQKKIRKQVEDEMQEWVEKELIPSMTKKERRASIRVGGRRSYDTEAEDE